MDLKDEIAKRRKEQWYELIFSIEVVAVEKDLAAASLADHVSKIEKAPGIFVYEKRMSEISELHNPMPDVAHAFAQVATVKLFIKDLFTTMTAIMLFGPSSVEVLGPARKDVPMGDVQSVANNVAALVHQFAAAGIGGMVIAPPGKPSSGQK